MARGRGRRGGVTSWTSGESEVGLDDGEAIGEIGLVCDTSECRHDGGVAALSISLESCFQLRCDSPVAGSNLM